jgi:peptide/nickel transport system substrate-binding protein
MNTRGDGCLKLWTLDRRPAAVLLAVLVGLVAGCSGGAGSGNSPGDASNKAGEATAGAKPGGVLTMARPREPDSLDPIVPTDNESIYTMLLIYDQLVRVAKDGKSVEAGLAETWETSQDGKTFTFHLRQGVKFHNGDPVTVDDVIYSLNRVKSDKKSGWADMYADIETIQAKDAATLVITTKRPYVPMLANLSMFAASIVPKKLGESGYDFNAKPVGSGPFVFDHWSKGTEIVLKKNPDYWQKGLPYLDEVRFLLVAEDNTRNLKLQAGEVDIAADVPFSSIAELKSNPDVTVKAEPLMRVDFITMNTTRKPFDDVKIRQAVNYAVDKDALIQAVLFGNGKPANTFLPPMLYHDDAAPGYKNDVAKAKELITQSSQPNGFKTTLNIASGDSLQNQVAIIVKEQLAKIGIDVTIQQLESGVKRKAFRDLNYDLSYQLMTSDVIDPDELTMFGGASATKTFWTGYNNPKVDQLAKDGQAETDPAKRAQIYKEIQKILSDDAPYIYLYYVPAANVTSKRVQNFTPLLTGNYRLEEVQLSK